MNKIAKSLVLKLSLAVLVVALDIVTKNIFYGQNLDILPSIIGTRDAVVLNTGGAWGILSGNIWVLIFITAIFLALVVLEEVLWKNTHPLFSVAFGFIVGGAVGNLLDRIFLGGVRDFIYFEFWPSFPTFNLADSFLCVGMILLAIYILFFFKPKGEEKK
jgi:signal peptidase II